MENQNITLQTILDVMNSKFEKLDKRLDCIDSRLDGIDNRLSIVESRLDAVENRLCTVESRLDAVENRLSTVESRLDNIDIRITRLAADNNEAHEKIFEELQKQGNVLTRLEEEFGSKISILFDATQAIRDRLHLFGNQQLRFSEKLSNFSSRLSAVEKVVFAKNISN